MNPLSQLKDIHLPEAVSQWPPSLAWWLASLCSLLAIIIGFFLIYKVIIKGKFKRSAKKEFAALQNAQATIQELSFFLKRVALSCYPREQVASLHGLTWLNFLDSAANTNPAHSDSFSLNEQIWLLDIYSATPNTRATDKHFAICKKWLNNAPLVATKTSSQE